jgi:hypothetical protein
MIKNRPTIWYPVGAGGHWLNYLIWSNLFKKNLPFNVTAFSPPELFHVFNDYCTFLDFRNPHNDSFTGDIILGSNQAWYNFYLYNLTKNGMVSDNDLYNGAYTSLILRKKNIKFNLEWTLIWTNPEQFLNDLNLLQNCRSWHLRYDTYAEIAFDQYRKSCILPDLSDQAFRSNSMFAHWRNAIFEHETDKNCSQQQRIEHTEHIIDQLYWPGCKNNAYALN